MSDLASIIQSLYEPTQKLSFYQSGGKDPGTTNLDRFNQGSDLVNRTIGNVLAIKKQQLEGQKTQADTAYLQSEAATKNNALQIPPTDESAMNLPQRAVTSEARLKGAQADLADRTDKTPKQGFHYYKNEKGGNVIPPEPSSPGTGDTVTVLGKNDYNIAEKENQFWQRQWTDLINKNDPSTATSRSTIGTVGRANLQANRALITLSKPIVTKQEAGNVMADIAGIYQGGAPTQFGMSEQGYRTIYGNLQNALQSITGSPTDTLPDDIKNRLLAVLKDMKSVNTGILQNRINLLEKTQKNVISHYPQEWQDFKSGLIGGFNPEGNSATTGTSSKSGGVLHQDAQGNKAWVYPDGTFDEVK